MPQQIPKLQGPTPHSHCLTQSTPPDLCVVAKLVASSGCRLHWRFSQHSCKFWNDGLKYMVWNLNYRAMWCLISSWRSTVVDDLCRVKNYHCTLYSVHCSPYSALYKVYTVHRTVHTVGYSHVRPSGRSPLAWPVLRCIQRCADTVLRCIQRCADTVLRCIQRCADTVLHCIQRCADTVLRCIQRCADTGCPNAVL